MYRDDEELRQNALWITLTTISATIGILALIAAGALLSALLQGRM